MDFGETASTTIMGLSLSPLRRRHVLFGLILIFLPCTVFILISAPGRLKRDCTCDVGTGRLARPLGSVNQVISRANVDSQRGTRLPEIGLTWSVGTSQRSVSGPALTRLTTSARTNEMSCAQCLKILKNKRKRVKGPDVHHISVIKESKGCNTAENNTLRPHTSLDSEMGKSPPADASTDMTGEDALVERLAELQLRLQHLDAMYRAREEDVQVLSHHLSQLLTDSGNTTSLSAEARFLLNNTAGRLLRLPSAYHFLPHLLLSPSSLRPALALSKGRSGVSVILGVPTVKREVQSYLLSTVRNLIESMNKAEQDDTIIVVLIAETEEEYVYSVVNDIKIHFEYELESGLVEVIAPPASYYPEMTRLRTTLGDSPERVRWRTKQNLDFAFLMMYAQPKAMFYVQLEDDILAKPHFVTTMKTVALERITNKKPWFVLDFCQLGFIGKMFRAHELDSVIMFLMMFFNDKPPDWLIEDYMRTKVCRLELPYKHCKKAKDELWIHYKPSLFQHIGTHSSLKGKVQKLKDKQFGKVRLFVPHANPDASVESEIKSYKQYSLKRAYQGESFFWGLLPQPGDRLSFRFSSPLYIKRYVFRSGNVEHPSDRFYNTTVEVQPSVTPTANYESFNYTSDGFVVVGKFDNMGLADGPVDRKLGPIKELRLVVHSESDNWAILSEILIEPDVKR